MVKRVGKYEIGKTLGEGTFGKVKFAVNTETGEKVAIKILDKEKIQKQNMGAQIKKEISIMKMVKHHNIVKLYEVLASRTKIFIVLELITGGELFDKIVAESRFDEKTARFYFRQLIKGVKYCHGQGVCHRDLKPENLLLDEHSDLKISDFGLSALYTGSADDEGRATLLHTTCGTPNYVAPEVLNDKGYDGRAADIWSSGVILYVLLAGFLPFDEPHMSQLFRKIQKAEFTYPSWFTPQVRSLLDRIMVADPTKRASIAELEAHPWFIGPDDYHDDNDASTPGGGAAPPGAPGAGVGHPSSGSGGAGAAPVKPLAHAPSDKEIDEAVADIDGDDATPSASAGAASAPSSTGGHSSRASDGGAASGSSSSSGGPPALNAFELVNMFGGLALNQLLEAADRREKLVAVNPQFISSAPATTIINRIATALSSLGAGTEVTVDEASFKVKGKVTTGRGAIRLTAQIFRVTDGLSLVEIRRGRGDLMEFNALHAKVRGMLEDIISRGSVARLK